MAIVYLVSSPAAGGSNLIVVYLTILASAASVLTGLFLRLILCCVIGANRDEDGKRPPAAESGMELDSVNPVFDDDDDDGGL